tara:strand:+ start:129 stop:356 length:228 start_codon:yes stop_codon:yes gene_type:complete
MDIERLNIYKRLRDHFIPSAVLDEIFRKEEDVKTLKDAYDSLIKGGYKDDDAAQEIAKLIFDETGIEPDYGLEEE